MEINIDYDVFNKAQLEAVTLKDQHSLIVSVPGSGKALKNGTKVMTMKGSVNIEELKVGDKVLSYNGSQCKVTGVFPQGKKQVYEVEFSDGNVVECCGEHLWRYQTSTMRRKDKWDTQQIKYIHENIPLKIKSGNFNKAHVYIPMTEPIQYTKKKLPIHPYVLGAMLGDGYLVKSGQKLTNSEKDVTDRVDSLLNEIGYKLHQTYNNFGKIEYSIKITDSEKYFQKKSYFSQALFDLGLLETHSYDKFIPHIYLHSCIEDRLELLKGLIDTDGYKASSYYEFASSSERLAKDVKYLCESLGLTAKLSLKENVTYTYKDNKLNGRDSYRLLIKTSEMFKRLHNSQKHELKYKKPQGYARRSIVNIRLTDRFEDMTCISVDGKDNVFLIDNFIVTHNTKILVNRLAHLIKEGVNPNNILAITFSRTAANNMIDRLKVIAPYYSDKMAINTFHAITYRLLRNNVPYWRDSKGKSRDYEVKKAMCEIVVKTLGFEKKDSDVNVNDILYFITMQKNHTLSPDDKLMYIESAPYEMKYMKKIYKLWEDNKVKNKLIMFDDMVYEGYKLIRDNTRVRNELQAKYQYIMVDESNDLTALQYEIIRLIGMKAKSVAIIGDNSQEIFQFIGASNQHMKNFVNDFDNVKVINSNINYRSQGKIVECYNKFLMPSPETKYKYYAPAKAFKKKGKDVEYNVFLNGKEEAVWICNKIKELVQDKNKFNYGDMMILYRTNAQSQPFEEVFANNEIPYHLEGGISFYNRKEIKDIISYLKLIVDSNDNEAWDRIANVPNRFFGNIFKEEVATYTMRKKCSLYESMLSFPRRKEWRYKSSIDTFEDIINKCKSVNGRYKVSTVIEMLRKSLDYDNYISREYDGSLDNSRIENLNSFMAQASDYKDIGSFLKSIQSAIQNDEDKTNKEYESSKKKVQLKSMHSAKGTEAPVAFVVGFSEGLIPHHMNDNIEAERLLGYVALSRAEEEMYVSSVLIHNKKEMEVSSFLYDCFDESLIDDKIEECWERLKAKVNVV